MTVLLTITIIVQYNTMYNHYRLETTQNLTNYFTELFVKTAKYTLVSPIQTVLIYKYNIYRPTIHKTYKISTILNIQGGQNATETYNEINISRYSRGAELFCVCVTKREEYSTTMSSPEANSSTRNVQTSEDSRNSRSRQETCD